MEEKGQLEQAHSIRLERPLNTFSIIIIIIIIIQ
jgi:hypothetical protein